MPKKRKKRNRKQTPTKRRKKQKQKNRRKKKNKKRKRSQSVSSVDCPRALLLIYISAPAHPSSAHLEEEVGVTKREFCRVSRAPLLIRISAHGHHSWARPGGFSLSPLGSSLGDIHDLESLFGRNDGPSSPSLHFLSVDASGHQQATGSSRKRKPGERGPLSRPGTPPPGKKPKGISRCFYTPSRVSFIRTGAGGSESDMEVDDMLNQTLDAPRGEFPYPRLYFASHLNT